MNTKQVTEHLNSLTPLELARLAECYTPYSFETQGSAFLHAVRISVIENWKHLTETGDDLDANSVAKIADACVPASVLRLWEAFVDLGGYKEDVAAWHATGMTEQARVALYIIATRLVYALIKEGKAF